MFLRWTGTIVLLVAAMALWIEVELDAAGPSEVDEQLMEIQRTIDRLNRQQIFMPVVPIMPEVPITPIEPIQTADIIPDSAFKPAATHEPLQTAKIVHPR